MANRIPLVVVSSEQLVKELPVGDNLELGFSNIQNVSSISSNTLSISTTGVSNGAFANLTIFANNTGITLNVDQFNKQFIGFGNTDPRSYGDFVFGTIDSDRWNYCTLNQLAYTEPQFYQYHNIGYSTLYNSYGNIGLNAYLNGDGKSLNTDIFYFRGYNDTANAYLELFGGKIHIGGNNNVGIGTTAPNTRLHIAGTTTLQEVLEKSNTTATAMGANVNFNVLDSAVVYFTANTTANSTLNIRGNTTINLNSVMSTNQVLTIAFAVTTNTTPHRVANLQIDGAAITPRWSGGSAPTATANSTEVYSFTVFKTGSAAYTVLGSKTSFA